MFCRNCGNEVREGAVFCPHCGAKQAAGINSGTEKKIPEKPKKKVKGGMIALITVVALASAASIGCTLYFTSDSYVSRKNMKLAEEGFEAGEYEEALAHLDEALERAPGLAEGYVRSADIYVQEEKYEEAIEILEEGLEKARDDEESRKILEEKIREVERQEKSAAAKKLQEYLEEELAPRYGYADLSTKKRTISSQDWAENWTGVRGIACAEIRDWDDDEWDEMLVITLENENILLSMYEVENNVPVKKAEYSEERYSDMLAYDVAYSAVRGGGADYLLFRESSYGILSDGWIVNVKLYRYDGANFYMPLAFLSPGGGSAGLMLTAYEYDKNGSMLSEETVYNDIYGQGTAYDSPHFYGRAAELFGKYGLVFDAGAVISGEKKMFDDLEASDGYKELLALSMWGVYQDGASSAVYHFNDWDSPIPVYQSFLRGERTVRVSKSAWCGSQNPRFSVGGDWYGNQEQMDLTIQELQTWLENAAGSSYDVATSELMYSYLDCGGDGVEELEVTLMRPSGYLGGEAVISCKDGELELIFHAQSANRFWTIPNYYGCLDIYQSISAFACRLGRGYIDGEGGIHEVYSLEQGSIYEFLVGADRDICDKVFDGHSSDMSLSVYEIDGSTYYVVDAYETATPECQEFIALMQEAGRKFVQEEEMEDIIAQRKKELGVLEASAPDLYWYGLWYLSRFNDYPILNYAL